MLRRRRRPAEQGQALVLVIAFFLFFSLVAGAVVGLTKAVFSQRASTEATASIDATAEGSAQFSMADVAAQQCPPASNNAGTISFGATADGLFPSQTLTYSGGCTPSTLGGTAPGGGCLLCLLNDPLPNPQTPVLYTNNKTLNVAGEVDGNGSVAGVLTSTGTPPAIGLYDYGQPNGATCGRGAQLCTSPTPTDLTTPFTDPLAGKLPISSSPSPPQTCCTTATVIGPGVYSSLSVTTGTVFMKSGAYIATGPISIGGGGNQGSALTNSDSSSSGVSDGDSGGLVVSNSGGLTDSGPSPTQPFDSGSGAGVAYANSGNNGTMTAPTGKIWAPGQWVGALLTVTVSGTTQTNTVMSNTNNKLTLNNRWPTPLPPAGSAYTINTLYYTANTLVDTQSNWTNGTNQWANAQVTVTLTNGTTETGIVNTNTATTLTMKSNWTTLPAPANAFSINTLYYTTNTLVDLQKAWTTNQWANAQVTVTLTNGTTETAVVNTNTGNTLTMKSNWGTTIPSPGSAYTIRTLYYTTNTLVDTQKTWTTNQWANAQVTVTLTNGTTENGTVSTNTSNTLTMSANWATVPAPGNAYTINGLYYTTNTLVDTQKTWTSNQWTNAQVTVTLSNGSTETGTVSSNTSNTLTLSSPWATVPSPGNAYTAATPVVIYLACPTAGPYWACSAAGQSGGSLSSSGQGRIVLTATTSGLYAGIAVYTDPNLTDPNTNCAVLKLPCAISVAGNGGSLGGLIYAPRATMNVSGNGSTGNGWNVGGRVIVRDLYVAGNTNSDLTITGASGSPITTSTVCGYYNESLTGTAAAKSLPGQLLFEAGCGAQGVTKRTPPTTSATTIISFTYLCLDPITGKPTANCSY
ncbi:MAG: hypothetical protein ACREN2_10170 [Candidatus Dormibacteria bacterium]